MDNSIIELPTNSKFGFFFTGVFSILAAYFWYSDGRFISYGFVGLSVLFLVITLVNADAFFALNKLWMGFGLLLGKIVSPIVLGIMFFLMFTPIGFAMRVSGRDELRLRFRNRSSHWIKREVPTDPESFKNQF